MARKSHLHLARRERQIIDVVFRLGEATVAQVLAHVPDPPSYSAVRAMMRLLEEKGHLKHRQQGARYIYRSTQSRDRACQDALKHLLHTFFDDSAEHAVAALLDLSDHELSDVELTRLSRKIADARKNEESH